MLGTCQDAGTGCGTVDKGDLFGGSVESVVDVGSQQHSIGFDAEGINGAVAQ